ncbi:hypothetical protein Tco_0951063 [Tanacetum coccineum]|uniref:Reverse transcriptase domain-containing protein n=1 Tax=Tanacetum coccineum TaxID=301880 RepID=A0ABQ5DUS5_9ASTR
MRTCSSSNLIVESSTIPKRRNRRRSKQIVEPELRTIVETPVATMADTRTMSELLQAPTGGYEDVIVIPAILAENFELKHDVTALTEIIKELVLMNKATQQATVKAIEETCVTCGGPHPYYECLAADGNTFNSSAATGTYNQGGQGYRPQGETNYRASNQMRPPDFPQPNVQNNQNQYNQNQGYIQNRGNNFNQGNQNYQAPFNQTQVGPSNDFSNYMKTNDVNMRGMQNQISNMKTEFKNEIQTTMRNQSNELNNDLKNMMSSFFQMNSPSGSGSLPSNTVANSRGDLKAITTRSGVSYDGPTIPPTSSPLPKELPREPEATKDKPEVAPKPNPKPSIPYPLRLNDQKLREKANNQMLKFLQIFQRLHFDLSFVDALLHMPKFASTFKSLLSNKEKLFELAYTPLNENCSAVLLKKLPEKLGDPDKFLIPCDFSELVECLALADLGASINLMPLSVWKNYRSQLTLRVNDEAITFKVGHTSRYPRNYYDESVNQINVIDVACEEYAQEVLRFLDSSTSGNPTPSDPIISSSSPSFTPFEGGDFILEEMETFLHTPDTPSNLDDDYYDTEGDILYLEKLLNEYPSQNLSSMKNEDLKQVDVTMTKPSIEEPPELELKDLPPNLEYSFLEGTDKLPVIISKELKDEEKAALLKVLKSHKWAIAWKISDIKGIYPRFCTHKILMEDDFKPAVQHQRRVNPKIHEVIKKEVIKLLDARLIYPISDSPWVSPVHYVTKKGGMSIIENEDNELIPT